MFLKAHTQNEIRVSNTSTQIQKTLKQAVVVMTDNVEPFKSVGLIKDIPGGYEYSVICDFEQHIYLGTANGDLFHYMEIAPLEYVLVSKTHYAEDDNPETENGGIKQILVINSAQRALILTTKGSVYLYDLPDFQRVSKQEIASGIQSIEIYSSNNDNEFMLIDNQNQGVVCKITRQSDILIKTKIVVRNIRKFLRQGDTVLVVNSDWNYELIQPVTSGAPDNRQRAKKRIPLFKAFEDCGMDPVACCYSDSKFLVVCGSTAEEPSMAMVIDHDGNITNGTVVLDRGYPTGVLVKSTCVFFQFSDCIQVYELDRENPHLLQTIPNGHIFFSTLEFPISAGGSAQDVEQVVDRLKLVPVCNNDNSKTDSSVISVRKDQEKIYVEKLYELKTNIIVFNNEEVRLMYEEPLCLKIHDFSEGNIEKCEEILTYYAHRSLDKFEKLSIKYLETFQLILLVLHCEYIDESLLDKILKKCDVIDLRLFYYILGFPIFGDLWVFNGLSNNVEKLKILKLQHKLKKPLQNLSLLLKYVNDHKEKTDDIRDFENVHRTITFAYINYWIGNCDKEDKQEDNDFFVSNLDLINFQKFGDEFLTMLRGNINKNTLQLQKVITKAYLLMGRYDEYLEMLIQEQNTDEINAYFMDNFQQIQDKDLKPVVLEIMLKYNKGDRAKLDKVFQLIQSSENGIDVDVFLHNITDLDVKIQFLELQLEEDKKILDGNGDKNALLLLNLYITQIKDLLLNKGVLDKLNKWQTEYTKNLEYRDKKSFTEYVLDCLEIDDGKSSKLFLETHERLLDLKISNMESFYQEIIDNFQEERYREVTLLFICDVDNRALYIGEDKTFQILLGLNDFRTIDSHYLKESNFKTVLTKYMALDTKHSIVALRFLETNYKVILGHNAVVLDVFSTVSEDWKNSTIFDFLYDAVINLKYQRQNIEMKKVLLKQQLNEKIELTKTFSK